MRPVTTVEVVPPFTSVYLSIDLGTVLVVTLYDLIMLSPSGGIQVIETCASPAITLDI